MSEFKWGTVTQLSPLRVQLDGDAAALPFAPDSLVDPADLAVSSRVRCEISGRRLTIHGRGGGLGVATKIAAGRGFKNRVANGRFRVDQYGFASGATFASGVYFIDRWKANANGTVVTKSTAPQGASIGFNADHGAMQIIERANMVATTYAMAWGGSNMRARIYNFGSAAPAYSPVGATSLSVTVDGSADVIVEITTDPGVAGTINNIQLEIGTVPTAFEYIPYAVELLICQRYFVRFNSLASAVSFFMAAYYTTTDAYGILQFPTTMRAVPTMAASAATILTVSAGGSGRTSTAIAFANGTPNGCRVQVTTAAATAGFAAWVSFIATAGAWITASAEM